MKRKLWQRTAAVLAACTLLLCGPAASAQTADNRESGGAPEVVYERRTYNAFLAQHADAARPETSVTVSGTAYSAYTGEKPEATEIDAQAMLSTAPEGEVTWTVNLAEAGLYRIEVEYYPLSGKGSAIERGVRINGEQPYTECAAVAFDRVWVNEAKEIAADKNGNDLRPGQVEQPALCKTTIHGASGAVSESLYFYFEAGENRLTLEGIKEPMAVSAIRVYNDPPEPDYADYLAAHGDASRPAGEIPLQGEAADRKSSTVLYPVNDRTSPMTTPYDVYTIKMNAIGGENWRFPAQWIEWDFTVPEAGLYKLAIRCRNDYMDGAESNRRIYIDGEIPFRELDDVTFPYSLDWQVVIPGGEEPYLIYLEAGEHTLRLENTVGPLTEIIRQLDETVYALNTIYRKIVMITGTLPDANRDYRLHKVIPEMLDVFREQSAMLHDMCARMEEITGARDANFARLQKMAVQLDSFLEDSTTVAKRLDSFRTNISDLASWMQSVCEQPLLIDYLTFLPADAPQPKADASFFRRLWHGIQAFFLTFVNDYSLVESDSSAGRSVELWMGATANVGMGRDQAQIFKGLIDNSFTPKEDIAVNLKLVDMAVLLPAVAAERGPDVAIGQAQNMPVNYALRGAVQDLSGFTDIDEVLSRFSPAAVTAFRVEDAVYALPEVHTFSMMFYRVDVLAGLGLSIPRTWDEFHAIIPILQKNNLDVGLPNIADEDNPDLFYMLLYQHGGQLYRDDMTATALDSDESVEAFTQWADLYNKYKAPQKVDLLTRFRTGEVPLLITNYSFYGQVSALAPEIRGLWDFTTIPGTPTENGINRQVGSSVTGTVMFRNAEDPEAAWRFMEWWTRAETQADYAREIENLQGMSGRWMTANLEAFESISWTSDALAAITEQRESAVGLPEIPGSYMTPRYLINSIRLVVNNSAPVRDTLLHWNEKINNEITLKRKEFGFT